MRNKLPIVGQNYKNHKTGTISGVKHVIDFGHKIGVTFLNDCNALYDADYPPCVQKGNQITFWDIFEEVEIPTHSVFTHCWQCGARGVNTPDTIKCGNCNNLNTSRYYSEQDLEYGLRQREKDNALRSQSN